MIWNKISKSIPKNNKYYLVFSPCYEKNNPMRIRIIESQFIRILTDATHWAGIEEPKNEEDTK